MRDQPAARRPRRQVRLENPAQRPDVAVDDVRRARRRVRRPQQVHELAHADRLAAAGEQERQHRTLLWRAEPQLVLALPGSHGA